MSLCRFSFPFLFLAFSFLFSSCKGPQEVGYHFDAPASVWEETIPLGNGRIGMMPWGGIDSETLVLNEITMWSGSPQNADNPEAGKYLAEIRSLLFQGKNKEAQDLMYKTFTCLGAGSAGGAYGNYQVFGDLVFEFDYPPAAAVGYRRDLNMNRATSSVSFEKGGVKYSREYFTSMTDDIGVARFTSSGKKNLSFKVSFRRDSDYSTFSHGNLLIISGKLSDGITPDGGISYAGSVLVKNVGGVLSVGDSSITVTGADEAVVFVSMATDYCIPKGRKCVSGVPSECGDCFDVECCSMKSCKCLSGVPSGCGDSSDEGHCTLRSAGRFLDVAVRKALGHLAAAADKSYEQMLRSHSDAFSALFDRVELRLPRNTASSLPIDKRLAAFEKDDSDADLVALYMQYGRYLLISSTREGSLPPNLQGLWAHQIHTPWNCDYHLNINLQMNLWPAEPGNLSELHMPMIDYTRSLVPHGEKTASTYYGSRGWVTHILGNVWSFTSPSENPSWGATNTAGAWLCRHIWEHYLYTQDKDFLAEYYPVMRGAALFFSDMLIEDPNTGYLLTAPTTSPENSYYDSARNVVNICAGSTMDNQIVREIFTNTIEAARVLGLFVEGGDVAAGCDTELCKRLLAQLPRLAPTMIGRYGQIMEWNEDYEEVDVHHRHVSQLYGLYPGNQLTYSETPELMEAARTTLERRGDWSTGWSMAWKISFWARLKDGERAYKLVRDLLHPAGKGQGTYPNLFSAHPPMQIDGNFGGSAGIMEMLVQSHEGHVEYLPAIPFSWKYGYCRGLRIRGGKEVEIRWRNGKVRTREY